MWQQWGADTSETNNSRACTLSNAKKAVQWICWRLGSGDTDASDACRLTFIAEHSSASMMTVRYGVLWTEHLQLFCKLGTS